MSKAYGLGLICLSFALIAQLLNPSQAMGGLATPDGTPFGGVWYGTTPFVQNALHGHVEWAVYGPGSFPYGGGGYTPTPSELVYAYQVFADSDSAPISLFQVLVDDPADNPGHFNNLGGVIPDTDNLSYLSDVTWTWGAPFPGGGKSYGLAFSSNKLPELGPGAVIDDGETAFVIPLPTTAAGDIPEPASLGLMVVAAGTLLRRR